MQNNVLKYSIIGVVIILLVLLGAFALLGNSGKNSTPAVIPPISFSEKTNPDKETNPEIHEVVPVRELTGYEDVEGFEEYINSYHACGTEGVSGNYEGLEVLTHVRGQNSINGHPFFLRIDSLKKGEYLNFSLVYKNDDDEKKTWLNFKSDSVELVEYDGYPGFFYYSYLGCLTNPNNKDYRYCTERPKHPQACSTNPSDKNYHKDCVNKPKGGVSIAKRKSFKRIFKLEDTFFNSGEKGERKDYSMPVYLYPQYLLTIKHEGVLEIP